MGFRSFIAGLFPPQVIRKTDVHVIEVPKIIEKVVEKEVKVHNLVGVKTYVTDGVTQDEFHRRGEWLKQLEDERKAKQDRCNHLKGGYIDLKKGTWPEQGHGVDYAIIKHQFPWGDVWVRCIRCGKTWKPGMEDYKQALNFPTHNYASTSIQFTGTGTKDGKTFVKIARESTKDS